MPSPVGSIPGDPIRAIRIIVVRLVVLIALFYMTLFGAVTVLAAPYGGNKPVVLMVFDPSLPSFRLSDFRGIMMTTSYLLTSVLIAPCVWKLAKRSAKCADFAVSVFVIHFLLTWFVDEGGFPRLGAFYMVLLLGAAISSLLSERLALREEMAEIPLDKFVASKNRAGGDFGAIGSEVGRGGVPGGQSEAGAMRIEMV